MKTRTESRPPILTIVGARPQFVKAAPVSQALARCGVDEVLLHTGQHYDDRLSAIFFRELGLATPNYSLNIGSGSHARQTGRMMEAIEEVVGELAPARILVYGDTNSTLAGAMVAAKAHIPVDHVEAGLRSFNRRMPEEVNRVVTDHLSDLRFAPTSTAVENLSNEGICGPQVILSGDVMYDATLATREKAFEQSVILETLGLTEKAYVLATVHRSENTEDPARMKAIFDGLVEISADLPVVLPLHPRTRSILEASGQGQPRGANLLVLEPIGYHDINCLEASAALIATDSGGMQKEAFFHRVPCVTLRPETEWTELIELDWNILANPSTDDIAEVIRSRLGHEGREGSPYGNGAASEIIAESVHAVLMA